MAAYADYTYYTDTYKGNIITEFDFDRLITRAGSWLDRNKTGTLDPASDAVKMAACAVAEAWQINEQGGELQSQSVGSWSRTFAVRAKSVDARLMDAARLYLPELVRSVGWC